MKFKCEVCGSNMESITPVRFKIINGETNYFICGEEVKCCNVPMTEVKGEFKGFATAFSTFNSKSSEEKKAILRKREREHDKRDKNLKEYKHFKDNGGID